MFQSSQKAVFNQVRIGGGAARAVVISESLLIDQEPTRLGAFYEVRDLRGRYCRIVADHTVADHSFSVIASAAATHAVASAEGVGDGWGFVEPCCLRGRF